MPVTTYIQDGDAIDYTPVADTPAGTVVVQGDLIGITKQDIAAGELGALAVTGVFDMPKALGASTAVGIGTRLYWESVIPAALDSDNSGARPYLGKSVAAATDDDTTVRVRLSQ